jgi:putative FmdB family regulatory protein
MPIYEYVCESCGETTEVLVRVSQPAPEVCPSGDGGHLHRVLSAHNAPSGGAGGGESYGACGMNAAGDCGRCGDPGSCN